MSKAIFYKSSRLFIFCIATLLFVLSIPITSHGADPCDYNSSDEITVNVAPNIVNITSQGEGHAVVVHTLQKFALVNREKTQVFVNDGGGGNYDCPIKSFGQREDDNGNLDIYFPLDELKPCKAYLAVNYELNILRIEGVYDNLNFRVSDSNCSLTSRHTAKRCP